MWMPKCPLCGGPTESIEPAGIDQTNRGMSSHLHTQAMLGHPHPLLKAINIGISVGRQVYKRVPGGGEKRCKNCGHEFR